jgi:acyl-CoA thioesterase I
MSGTEDEKRASYSDVRIAFLGDSYVAGIGDPDGLGWAGRLCAAVRRHGYHVAGYNLGLIRDTCAQGCRRLRDEVPARLPDGIDGRLIVSYGVSDVVLGTSSADFEESMVELLNEAARRWPLLVIGPTPAYRIDHDGRRLRDLSRRAQRACESASVPYLEIFDALVDAASWRDEAIAYDGYHPMREGYTQLARLVADWAAWRMWFPEVSGFDVPVGLTD